MKIASEPEDLRRRRLQMVEEQIRSRGVRDPRVLAAMEAVPRHLFVDPALEARAYADFPLPIREGQTISQPYIVAAMTEALELSGEEKVLEIGTGSGYQAAILSLLARKVFTVERHPSLAFAAEKRLASLEIANVLVRVFDGTYGWNQHAPFNAIVVTAGAREVPPPLFDQLADGGRLVAPVGPDEHQRLVRVRRQGERFRKEDLGPVRFVRLIGKHGWPSES